MNRDDNCVMCGEKIKVNYCCDGTKCTCLGIPLEPRVCSDDCYTQFMVKHNIKILPK